jgi:predicted dienelactone hydrolase
LDALLAYRDPAEHWGEDESLQVVFAGHGIGGWVVMTRYKSRGATALAYYISQELCEPLSLELAEAVLAARGK